MNTAQTQGENLSSIKIKLPNGVVKDFPKGSTLLDVAASVGGKWKQSALAGKVNGKLSDLTTTLNQDAEVEFFTFDEPEGVEIYRHSSAHILAQAVKRLFPQAKISIGPSIENGFYYDIEFPRQIVPEDLESIEKEIDKIIDEKLQVNRQELPKDEAIKFYESQGEKYKVEMLQELPENEVISIYTQGEFTDLCRGPHIPHTGYIRNIKLLSIAGAYWRGDEKREMLTRIYGTSFPDKKQLRAYLQFLEEAKKRDHRKIGKELDLFSFQEEGPGFPFFHHKGVVVFNQLIGYCREELDKLGYVEIKTPTILNEALWHKSGHWDHYKENMYFTDIDEVKYAVKPMNCPGGLLVFKSHHYSYRDLPLKVAEFGQVHRHEKSGVLHGLFRVRCFTQDDAHVFCTEEQLEEQIIEIIDLIFRIYRTFGFEDVHVELSTRPEKSIGSDDVWNQATTGLQNALERKGIKFKLNPGDGAFYGPKIDFHIKDCLNRRWQCATIQVDFSMPERFDLGYIARNGARKRPVMIHRALFGSLERFIGILIEHYEGNFPLWIAPIQVTVLPITSDLNSYAAEIRQRLFDEGFRVKVDESEETLNKKIRNAEHEKIPIILVVGQKEAEGKSVAMRRHKKGQVGVFPINEAITLLKQEVTSRKIAD